MQLNNKTYWTLQTEVESYNGCSWGSLVPNQRFMAIYHYLSSIAVSRIIYTSLQPTYFSNIFMAYLQLLAKHPTHTKISDEYVIKNVD